MNRIEQLFKTKNGNILSVFFTAGFPQLNDTLSIIKNLEKSGADMIEIGFPFSDPLADGPVIQQSSNQAIENGMTLALLFDQLKDIRQHVQIPLILMGYLNPVMQYGEEQFVKKCKEIGIDGLILPDMPLDHFEKHFKQALRANNLSNILLITPDTALERIKYIDSLSDGFIYMVSSNSITGANKKQEGQIDYFQRVNQMKLKNPTLIGFGIHNHQTFQDACRYSHGAIIGTAFIKHIAEHGIEVNSIHSFIKSIKQ